MEEFDIRKLDEYREDNRLEVKKARNNGENRSITSHNSKNNESAI